jgi:hypothetical protein
VNEQDIVEVGLRGDRIAQALTRLSLPADSLTATAAIGVVAGLVHTLHIRRQWAHAALDRALNDLGAT